MIISRGESGGRERVRGEEGRWLMARGYHLYEGEEALEGMSVTVE